MKKRFSEEQIAFALRQAETGVTVQEVMRKMGISEQTFYRWKKTVWRVGRLGAPAIEAIGRGESEIETVGRRFEFG